VHGEDDESFGAGDDDDGPLRGWVPRDDRLWLHPSERAAAGTPTFRPPAPGVAHPAPRGQWVIGGLTVCVALALVLTGMVATAGSDAGHPSSTGEVITGVPTTEADLSRLTTNHNMVRLASSVRDSTVALVVTTGAGTRAGTGVVAEAGGIVVALDPAVAGARSITVVEQDGTRQPAVAVGSDPATGISVLRIPDDLPVAAFTTGDPATGTVAVAMSVDARATGAPTARLYAGKVLYAGLAARAGRSPGFCGTAIAAPLTADDLGSPLVEPSGAVAGLLDTVSGVGVDRTAVFLPGELVLDVTAQIVLHGAVVHGDIGAQFVDPSVIGSAAAGALVAGVGNDGSAAQAGIREGDLVVAVDGAEVRSQAELATRLYADPPGTEVPVTLVRSGVVIHTTAVLGAT